MGFSGALCDGESLVEPGQAEQSAQLRAGMPQCQPMSGVLQFLIHPDEYPKPGAVAESEVEQIQPYVHAPAGQGVQCRIKLPAATEIQFADEHDAGTGRAVPDLDLQTAAAPTRAVLRRSGHGGAGHDMLPSAVLPPRRAAASDPTRQTHGRQVETGKALSAYYAPADLLITRIS